MDVRILYGPVPGDSHADQSAAGRALLALLLNEAFPGESVEAAKDGRGKPCLPAHPETGISISHGGGFVAAALGPGRIGIDLEGVRTVRPRVLAHYFTQTEREEVERGGDGTFTRLWTMKEALGKALGTGLADRSLFARPVGEAAAEEGLALYALSPVPGLTLTLAAEPGSRIVIEKIAEISIT